MIKKETLKILCIFLEFKTYKPQNKGNNLAKKSPIINSLSKNPIILPGYGDVFPEIFNPVRYSTYPSTAITKYTNNNI